MSLSRLAEFYRATGRPAEVISDGLWVAETRLSVMHIPGAMPIAPLRSAVEGLLRGMGRMTGVFAPSQPTGVPVSAFVIRDRGYGLHCLQRQFRQQTRRALEHFVVRPISWRELAGKGVRANHDSQARRGQGAPAWTDPVRWEACCEAGAAVPGFEVSGCLTREGELVAYMITWIRDGICHGLQLQWTDRHREHHPTHALYYETIRERFSRAEVKVFSVGRQTLPAMPSVDRFKEHAGFVREPCRLAVVIRPGFRWLLVNPFFLGLLRAGRGIGGGANRLRNLEVLEAAARTCVA